MPDRIKIGMLGTGHAHARGKMSVLRKSDLYEVVGVVELDEELRRTARQERVYKDLPFMTAEQLLNTRGLAAVAVEGRVAELLAGARLCVDAGKHIHLDKPAGSSLSTFRALLEDIDRKHLVLQMGYMFRYNAGFELLHRILRHEWLGRVYSVTAVISKVIRPPDRRRLARFSGGLMFELACHVIDQLVAVLGTPRKITPFLRHDATIDDGLADNTLAVFEFEHASATVASSAMEVEGFARRQFVVLGDAGVFDLRPIEPPALRLAFSKARGPYKKGYQTVPLPDRPRYAADFVDFAKCVRGEKDPEYSTAHDLAVQEAILRAGGMPIDT